MSTYPHLRPATARVMLQDKQARIAHLAEIPYIPTWNAVKALEWLSYLRRTEPGRDRPRGLHIVSPSNVGKTALLNHYVRQNDQGARDPQGRRPRPILLVEAPSSNHPRRLSHRIIEACMGNPVASQRGESPDHVEHVLRHSEVRQLLIDETGNLALGGRSRHQHDLALLKRLSNLGITLCIATTENMRMVLVSDEQLASRFTDVCLPVWSESEELRSFLSAVEAHLALPEPSYLDRVGVVRWLLSHDYVRTGAIFQILRDATTRAILEDLPCLTTELLDQVANSTSPPDGRTFGQ